MHSVVVTARNRLCAPDRSAAAPSMGDSSAVRIPLSRDRARPPQGAPHFIRGHRLREIGRINECRDQRVECRVRPVIQGPGPDDGRNVTPFHSPLQDPRSASDEPSRCKVKQTRGSRTASHRTCAAIWHAHVVIDAHLLLSSDCGFVPSHARSRSSGISALTKYTLMPGSMIVAEIHLTTARGV